jgi:hypothetical protein
MSLRDRLHNSVYNYYSSFFAFFADSNCYFQAALPSQNDMSFFRNSSHIM